MKLSPSTKGLLFAVISVVAAFGIYFLFLAKKNYYLVDNPTGNTYYFKINGGEERIIPSGQYFQVNLNKGRNSIQAVSYTHLDVYKRQPPSSYVVVRT